MDGVSQCTMALHCAAAAGVVVGERYARFGEAREAKRSFIRLT